VRIAPLTSPEERPALERLLSANSAFNAADVIVALELIDDVLTRGALSDYRILCAWQEDNKEALLGYVCFGKIPLTEAACDLYWIAVDPAAGRRGVGRELLGAAEAACLEDGGRHLYAETSSLPIYAPARAFYAATGFTLAAELPDFYGPGNDKLIYSKGLAGS
jgi:ribosomal protein S18 acetylase RimI-like enzyme